jgi:hypothetical protein
MPTKKFLIIVDTDVAGELSVPGNEKYLPLQDALVSGDFTVIEVPIDTAVSVGQKYDGTNFTDN